MRALLFTLTTALALATAAVAEEDRLVLTPAQQSEAAMTVAEIMIIGAQAAAIIHDDGYCPHDTEVLCNGYRATVLRTIADVYDNASYLVDRFKAFDAARQNRNQAERYLNSRDAIHAQIAERLATLREVIVSSGNTPNYLE